VKQGCDGGETVTPFLLITDLDNTLVGDDAALAELNAHLHDHRQRHQSVFVYSTGRSPTLYRQLTQEQSLLEPDILVLSVGTLIYRSGQDVPDPKWSAYLAQAWDRDQVVAIAAHFADLIPQPASEQTAFKASYFLSQEAASEVLPELDYALNQDGLRVQLIYSSGKDLDILPRNGNKGAAVAFLQAELGMSPEQTVVCGDSGNDISMFQTGRSRGIIVGNAQRELRDWHFSSPSGDRYLAKASCAGGILEGLRHFGLL
jgi:sucrose-6F-phosphate phosphohydrolase